MHTLEAANKFARLTGVKPCLDTVMSMVNNKPIFCVLDLDDKLKEKYPEYDDTYSCKSFIIFKFGEQANVLAKIMCGLN